MALRVIEDGEITLEIRSLNCSLRIQRMVFAETNNYSFAPKLGDKQVGVCKR
jgi:hypothetical protein